LHVECRMRYISHIEYSPKNPIRRSPALSHLRARRRARDFKELHYGGGVDALSLLLPPSAHASARWSARCAAHLPCLTIVVLVDVGEVFLARVVTALCSRRLSSPRMRSPQCGRTRARRSPSTQCSSLASSTSRTPTTSACVMSPLPAYPPARVRVASDWAYSLQDHRV